ncbi:hypothetical protein ACFLV6_03375 [Chloroflexota bacterium]
MRETSGEDPLVIYRPFLDDLNRLLQNVGETATLQEYARNPSYARVLQSAYRTAFQHVRDISELSPEQLVGFQDLAQKISVIISLFQPPEQRQSGYFDLGENIPQAYADWLLEKPHPFHSYLSDLFTIECGGLCSAEIERRGKERPEFDEILKYKSATPEREALKYLQDRTPYERARIAEEYGLKVLSQLEMAMGRAVTDITRLFTEKLGIKEGTTVYGKGMYSLSSGFPQIEKKMAAELVKESLMPDELDKCIKTECDLLIRCVAIDRFGLSIKNGYSPQEHEANQILVKTAEILKIKKLASKYEGALDRGVPSNDKLLDKEAIDDEVQTLLVGSNAAMESVVGLYEGMEYWANKELEEIVIKGLEGIIKPSLLLSVKRNLIDALRLERPKLESLKRHAREKYKPKTKEEKIKLDERIKELLYKVTFREPITSVDDKELLDFLGEDLVDAQPLLSFDGKIQIKKGGGDDEDKEMEIEFFGDMVKDETAQRFE